MADEEHLRKLQDGIETWNGWRSGQPDISPDLTNADLRGILLTGANLSRVDFSRSALDNADLDASDLSEANFSEATLFRTGFNRANLYRANFFGTYAHSADFTGANLCESNFLESSLTKATLSEANLTCAYFHKAYLNRTDLNRAILRGADLSKAYLGDADFTEADLSGANLQHASLINTNFQKANLTNCLIYGISAWNVNLEEAIQLNLIITPESDLVITVDNLEIAQFIYLLLKHKKIRDVITTIGERAVLILGRFTADRKIILDAIAEELRAMKYLPLIFDFERVPGRDYTETVMVLAGLSKFVIADITQPKSTPQESQAIIPDFKIPFVRIIQKGEQPWSMSEDFNLYDWVLKDVIEYPDQRALVNNFKKVVELAERKHQELMKKKAKDTLKTLSIEDIASSQID